MGKKGKKGKKGKTGKKSKTSEVTPKEGILAYQINIIEKKLEDVHYEIRGWEEKNRRHQERNEKLKSEQQLLLEDLLVNARSVSKSFENEETTSHEEVVTTMRQKWRRQRERERQLQDLKSKIAWKMVEIEEKQAEVYIWMEYRDVGSLIHSTEIRILEQELRDLQTSYDDMSTQLEKNLLKTRADIQKYTEETLALQKDKASDKAMAQLNKNDRQEVLDNDWLKKEVQIHRRETAKVRERVEDLERTNLEMMSRIFECTVEELKISQSFFLTQCENVGDMERAGILEMDLSCLVPLDADQDSPTGHPGSSLQKTLQKKVLSLTSRSQQDQPVESEGESEACAEPFPALMLEEEDFEDYLRLGPVELKLLSVSGIPAHLHKPDRLSSAEQAARDCNPEFWPVTQSMLKKAIVPS